MAEKQAEGSAPGMTSHSPEEKRIASVTDAVRVATEASLAPARVAGAGRAVPVRREAGGAKLLPGARVSVVMANAGEHRPVLGADQAPRIDAGAKATDFVKTETVLTSPSAVDMTIPSPACGEISAEPATAEHAAVNVPSPTRFSVSHTVESVMTTAEDLMSFQQGNFEAIMKSSQIWAAGLQDLGRHWAASAQAQMDETMGTVKAITAVKSMREAVELQSTLARSSMEKVVSEGGKLSDASLKLAEQTLAPITARLTVAAERFGRVA